MGEQVYCIVYLLLENICSDQKRVGTTILGSYDIELSSEKSPVNQLKLCIHLTIVTPSVSVPALFEVCLQFFSV